MTAPTTADTTFAPATQSQGEGLVGVVVVPDGGLAPSPKIGGVSPLLRAVLSLQAAGATAVRITGRGEAVTPPVDVRCKVAVTWADTAGVTAGLASVVVLRADVSCHREVLPRLVGEGRLQHASLRAGDGPNAPCFAVNAVDAKAAVDAALGEGAAPGSVWALAPHEFVLPVTTADERRTATSAHLRSLRKSTGGYLENLFMRPVSMHLTRMFMNTAVTPNFMTMVTLAHGLASAALVASPDRRLQVAGGLLHIWMRIVDCIDGELARLRFQGSRFGEWLDSVCDGIGIAAFLGAVTYRAGLEDSRFFTIGVLGMTGWFVVQMLQMRAAQKADVGGNYQRVQWGHRQAKKTFVESVVAKLEMALRIDAISTMYGLAVAFGLYRALMLVHGAIAVGAVTYFAIQVRKLAPAKVAA